MGGGERLRLLVGIADTGTRRETVSYAVRRALDETTRTGRPVTVTLVCPVDGPTVDEALRLLERSRNEVTRSFAAAGPDGRVAVETVVLELPTAGRDWDAFAGYARDAAADSIVLDPTASLRPPATRPTDALPVTVAPVGPEGRERPLVGAGGRVAVLTTFAVSLLFYLALGDPTDPFDLVTGAATAALVAGVFGRVAFAMPPTGHTLPRLVRAVAVLPYLLWAVTKSSVAVAAVVLRPEMPIDPSIDRVRPRTASDLERAVLANAITLTPGSLTVAVRDDACLVHTLTGGMRAGVRGGRLERVVRWLFGDETTSGDRDVG